MFTLEKPIYVTDKGLVELEEELVYLREVKRPKMIEEMQDAKDGSDWMDQTDYMLIEEEVAFLDGRINELEDMIRHAQLIGPGNQDNIVNIGETVLLQSEEGEIEQYTIVGIAEADPANGLISNESPLGRALLGQKEGDEVVVNAPMGKIRYQIITVS